MTVAVVIPHFGEPGPTLRLTSALAGQADRIVVVDDCSPVPFPPTAGVEVVRRELNGGFGQAVNSGVTVVDEQLVLVLNSDVEVGPSFVTDLVAAAAPYQPCVAAPRVVDPAGRVAETARLTGLSESAVKVGIHRGLKALALRFAQACSTVGDRA